MTQQSIFDREFLTTDRTPPLSPMSLGGVDVAAGAKVVLVSGNPGRVKVEVNHAGTDGRLWLGFGQEGQAGIGTWLDANQGWYEFYSGDVRVFNNGSSSVRVTFVEWGL